jgi:hypothetical protein
MDLDNLRPVSFLSSPIKPSNTLKSVDSDQSTDTHEHMLDELLELEEFRGED